MTVFQNAVTGFNHNIRHMGRAYHVQTEDSGVSNPHIVTHLFVGGTIIGSRKSSYAELLGTPNVAERVRQLMEEQHKAMLRSLLSGAYDAAVEQVEGRSFAPGQVQLESPGRSEPPAAASGARAAPPLRERAPLPPTATAAAPQARERTPVPPRLEAPAATPLPPPVPGFNHNIRHKGRPYHVQTEDSGVANPHIITNLFTGGTIVASKKTSYAEILRAANLQEIVRELMEEQHKAILRNLLSGAYERTAAEAQKRSYAPGEIQLEPPAAPLQTGMPTCPGAKPATPPPAPAAKKPKSLFGEDLLSEKSLDEVILAYLADDES